MKDAAMIATTCVAFVMLALFPQELRAERASAGETERVCRNWLSYVVHQTGDWAGEVDPTIVGSRDLALDGVVLARCFSISPRGHVVVPVLMELPPIKAYSDKCELDPSQRGGFPELLRQVLSYHLDRFVAEYGSPDAIEPNPRSGPFDRTNRERWDLLLSDPDVLRDYLRNGDSRSRAFVGPLLTTAWHQEAPYNNHCPDGDTACTDCYELYPPCSRTFTGCVATATAQIMNYHEWPPYGVGAHIHGWDGDHTCSASPPVGAEPLITRFYDEYDWVNMPDDCDEGCTEEQENAVAELCYEVGVAVEMDYGVCASMAWMESTMTALTEFFRYDPSIDWEDRVDYLSLPQGDSLWWELIRAEIDADRPVLYSLYTGGIFDAHALVCDGWNDYFEGYSYGLHLNFGWGSDSWNGWYALDDDLGWPGYWGWTECLVRNIMPDSFEIHHVSAGGGGNYLTIQAAVDAAGRGDVIELLDSGYSGDGNRDIDFQGKSLTVQSQSGNPALCVIDCGGAPHRGFYFGSGERKGAVLRGLTIQGGSADLGGGIYCWGGLPPVETSPTFIDCVVRDNSAINQGGGLYSSYSYSTVLGCDFWDNTVRGVGGSGHGGGVAFVGGVNPRIAYCTFSGDSVSGSTNMAYGGGLYCLLDSDALITHCAFYDNHVAGGQFNYGGGLYWESAGKVEHCSFSSNTAVGATYFNYGGGMYCTDTPIAYCTFFENAAAGGMDFHGGGISGGVLTLENTIISFSTDGGSIYCTGGTIQCCDFYGNNDGDYIFCADGQEGINGNISEDPLFCDPYGGTFLVEDISPCVTDPVCGQIGNWGIGCGVTDVAERDGSVIIERIRLSQNVPNPFNPSTRIKYAIPAAAGHVPVTLDVYGPSGRLVRRLVDTRQPSGEYQVIWDGTSNKGESVSSGVYFCRLRAGSESRTRKLLLVK